MVAKLINLAQNQYRQVLHRPLQPCNMHPSGSCRKGESVTSFFGLAPSGQDMRPSCPSGGGMLDMMPCKSQACALTTLAAGHTSLMQPAVTPLLSVVHRSTMWAAYNLFPCSMQSVYA